MVFALFIEEEYTAKTAEQSKQNNPSIYDALAGV